MNCSYPYFHNIAPAISASFFKKNSFQGWILAMFSAAAQNSAACAARTIMPHVD
jgi:hypothetical protein